MAKRFAPNEHFQLRLVKRFDGRRIVTYPKLGQPNESAAKDHILDFFDNERSVLQAARTYCARGEKRKGPLPGEFLGVVVVKFAGDPSRWGSLLSGAKVPQGVRLSGRPRRMPGTATWLYYLTSEGKALHVDPVTHEIGLPVG
jgi:hypothetical protein